MCVLGCGGVLYGDHGSFASPNYPGTYPNSSHCEWAIRAPRGRLLTVTFAQIYIDDPGSCQNNYLKLYDSPDASGQPVGPYCGPVGGGGSSPCGPGIKLSSVTFIHFISLLFVQESNIAPFTASSHEVFVVFHAQAASLPSGFRLTWSS